MVDPAEGLELSLRMGRYGLLVQRGRDAGDERAARGSMPKGMALDDITPDLALAERANGI